MGEARSMRRRRRYNWGYWKIDFFSYFSTKTQRYVCMTKSWQYCIPYSEEVDKYIGTKEYIKNNKKIKGNIAICPKIRQQLYDLKKNDILKLNGRKFKVAEVYNKESDTIKVSESIKTKDGDIIPAEISLTKLL